MKYLDANVLVHAAVHQDPRARTLSLGLLDRLQSGRDSVFIAETVISEVAAALRSARSGRLSHEQISAFLRPILAMPSVRLSDKGIWPRALDLFVLHNVDLPDAHQLALLERDREGEIVSFDTDFDRIPGVKRVEP